MNIRRLGLALVLALAGPAAVHAQAPATAVAPAAAPKPFRDDTLADAAIRLEEQIRKDAAALTGTRSADDFRRAVAQSLQRNDAAAALTAAGAAVATAPRDFASWMIYGRATLAVAATKNKDDDDNAIATLNRTARAAFLSAYQHASSRVEEAQALAAIGAAATQRERWRDALNAYKASLDRVENAPVRAAYDPLRAKYGFRILDYKVDSDSVSPRACFRFSESLAPGKVDFGPYVAVTGGRDTAVTTEDQQLCVEGLQHGVKYGIVVRQGLPSSVDESLLKSADYDIYVRDRSPTVRFTGKNYVLPRTGQDGIPLVTVNTTRVAIDVLRIGDRSLLPTVRSDDFLATLESYKVNKLITSDGTKVWSGTLDTASDLNKDVTTAFPVTEAVGHLEPGVYVAVARTGEKPISATSDIDGDGETPATQWFVVSDLGLTAFTGEDGVHVLVRSLADAKPMPGVEIRLVARNNEILATRTTPADGHVAFDPGLARGTGGQAPGLLVAQIKTADGGLDYGFLDLQQSAFDLTDRGVRGRTAPKGLDAFVFPERGVYRSGETVNVTAMLRDAKGAAASGLPLTLVVKRPDGVEYKRALAPDEGEGGRSLAVQLVPGSSTGTWRVQAFVDPKSPPLGEATFLVEDYVPERLDVTLTPATPVLRSGEPAQIGVDARFLYGAPGAGLDVTGEVTVQQSDASPPGLAGFTVGLTDESFSAVNSQLDDDVTTDANGHANVTLPIAAAAASRPLEASIILRTGEPGGRAVERTLTLPILPSSPAIAVKPTSGSLSENSTATFDVAVIDPAGRRIARTGVQWTLYRVSNDYQWFRSDGRWNFEQVKSSRKIADGRIDVGTEDFGKIAAQVASGTHRLDIKTDNRDDTPTSLTFEVGWGGEASASTPDLLQMTLDKTEYHAGDTAAVTLTSRFDGDADLVVVSDKVQTIQTVAVKTGDNAVSLPVGRDWGAGAYAIAIAHRPLDRAARRMPGRALGLAWFAIDRDARHLDVALNAPEKAAPRGPVTIPIKVSGFVPGEKAYVTLAAVDVGILNLTHYQPPEPTGFFFGQRQLASEVRDLYGYLIDGMQGTRGAIRSGGDAGGVGAGNKPTELPLSLYSGVVTVAPDGTAPVTFDMPAFNGTVRLMATAWSHNRVGEAHADMIVRDAVVVQATAPRFLALGDRSRIHLDLANVEGAAGDYAVDVDVHGPLTVPAASLHTVVRLAAGARSSVSVPVIAAGVGPSSIDIRLSGPNFDTTRTLAMTIESGTGAITRRIVRDLAPGASLTVSSDLLADVIPGTGSVSVSAAAVAAIDVPQLLDALDRYPYGCSEQTVSRALPLLYVNKLASLDASKPDQSIDARVRDSLDRVLARQASNGAFGLWNAGEDSDDVWLSAYVTDFLTRARESGYPINTTAFGSALDFLRNKVANAGEVEAKDADGIAYAAYVLARNGRPVIGDLRYLADTKIAQFSTPLARAQLAGALALLGDRPRAETTFRAATDRLVGTRPTRFSRSDYGTRLRDSAALLALGAETNMSRDLLLKASSTLDDERAATGTTSTQENNWMVLAAEALAGQGGAPALTLNGAPQTGPLYRTWRGYALDGATATIGNTGQVPARVVLTVAGPPLTPEGAAQHGYAIERHFFKLDGTEVNPSTVQQTDRLVVTLKVTELEAAYGRLMLVDPLPAGFEIDNPDLYAGGAVDNLDWLKGDIKPTHAEYRDDRFIAAFNRDGHDKATFGAAYIVRAVTPGHYVMPAASIEDMYRPDRYGRTATAAVDIAEK